MHFKQLIMAKYSKGASKKVEKVMHEKKAGTLRSGSGKKVTSRKQAIAIALSEAREEGEKVPRKKTATKTASKKSATKKAAGKKASAKKAAPKKAAPRKAVKKATTKKTASRKTAKKKSSR